MRALIWRSLRGLILFIGCGHCVLENTVRHCRNIVSDTFEWIIDKYAEMIVITCQRNV
ncbi:hypothetical protein [Enterobacter cancerogenus]|uniref:hypothetical protein n=1 Tax=Enterobacter cancerogenus TaxID=69218 RepID=UPI0028BAC822|nr:hypothetical protein [Enterobacter cancerogenus]MDT7012554.1 hypothetical protein [Enterobacter cancerogenus]WNN58741.1 hypothetical protein RIN64_10065 [Enterobacter cancerogenus]